MNFDSLWDWEEIVENIYSDIIVADKEGKIVYANSSVEYWLDTKKENLIGYSVMQLEKEGIFYPSVVKKVLETEKKQALIQQTRSGKKLLVIGNIVYDENQMM